MKDFWKVTSAYLSWGLALFTARLLLIVVDRIVHHFTATA